LSRYAPDDIDTDAKRMENFLNVHKGELKIPLSVAYAPNYQSLLDQAITLDNNIRKEENCKRKFSNGKTHIEPFHKRHHSSEGSGNGSSHRHGGHSAKEMVATSIAIGTMEDSGETTPMAITMVITMETMVSTVTTQKLRRISRISHASSARRMDTIPQAARRISLMNLPSPIHFRRDM
jgi:hypothetical protein